jgi:hypothetical protein
MIPILLVVSLLTPGVETIHTSLGLPVTIDYSIPEDFVPGDIEVTDDFVLLEQQGGSITIIPMVLDTLVLPSIHAVIDTLEVEISPPVLVVVRTMPDTTWVVPVFPAPLLHTIPPGLPQDYLERHSFWEKWGRAPSSWWLLPVILSAVVILTALLIWFRYRRNSKLQSADIPSVSKVSHSPLNEVKALLDSKAFAEGRWPEYYRDIDRLFRNTLAVKFGLSNRAFTWHQIRMQLNEEDSTTNLLTDATDLTREITLQRYAAWGGSRERAKRFTLILLKLREGWHRQ